MGVATSVGGRGSPSSATALPSVIAGERAEMMPATELAAWGWRIPFFFGLLIGPAGLFLRRYLRDAADYTEADHTATPVRDVFTQQKALLLVSIGALTVSTAVNYLLQYVPTFAIRELHLDASTGFAASNRCRRWRCCSSRRAIRRSRMSCRMCRCLHCSHSSRGSRCSRRSTSARCLR
jgi:MFS family permease